MPTQSTTNTESGALKKAQHPIELNSPHDQAGRELTEAAVATFCGLGTMDLTETRTQQALINSDVVPVNMAPGRKAFEDLGFRFGAVVENDRLFIQCDLPEGWKRKPGEDLRTVKIVDAEDCHRVTMFYNSNSYSTRTASMMIQHSPDEIAKEAQLRSANAPNHTSFSIVDWVKAVFSSAG